MINVRYHYKNIMSLIKYIVLDRPFPIENSIERLSKDVKKIREDVATIRSFTDEMVIKTKQLEELARNYQFE